MWRVPRDDSGPVRTEGIRPNMARGMPTVRGMPRHAVGEMLRKEQSTVLH